MSVKADNNKMAEDIKKTIMSLADDYAVLPEQIQDDDVILELGILDSPAVLELVCWYEEHFSIQLEDSEVNIDNLGTVAKMVNFALRKTGE